MEAIFGLLAVVLLVAGLFVYATAVRGLIIYKFWYWFVLPVFTTLPVITFYEALGFAFVISLFRSSYTTPKQTIGGKKIESEKDYSGLFLPWIVLLLGYLVHLFIN